MIGFVALYATLACNEIEKDPLQIEDSALKLFRFSILFFVFTSNSNPCYKVVVDHLKLDVQTNKNIYKN